MANTYFLNDAGEYIVQDDETYLYDEEGTCDECCEPAEEEIADCDALDLAVADGLEAQVLVDSIWIVTGVEPCTCDDIIESMIAPVVATGGSPDYEADERGTYCGGGDPYNTDDAIKAMIDCGETSATLRVWQGIGYDEDWLSGAFRNARVAFRDVVSLPLLLNHDYVLPYYGAERVAAVLAACHSSTSSAQTATLRLVRT